MDTLYTVRFREVSGLSSFKNFKNQITVCGDIAYSAVGYFILSHPVYSERQCAKGEIHCLYAIVFTQLSGGGSFALALTLDSWGSAPHPHRPSSTISGSASGRVCTGELTANQFTCINPPMKRCAYLFYYLLLSTACSS